jgi:hypothetical protein
LFLPRRERFFEDTGYAIRGDFLTFWERYGEEILGRPISDVIDEDGTKSQFFEHAALESSDPGKVHLKPLGRTVLDLHQVMGEPRPMVDRPSIVNLVYDLPRNPDRRYEMRSLARIQQLVIHHTGAAPSTGVRAIAQKHVEELGWPGIGYHFVVAEGGTLYQTNDLATVAFHARQANPTTVGVALCGNFNEAVPSDAQLDSTGRLCAYLLRELSLPPDNVRGHQVFAETDCPGRNWAEEAVWKDALLDRIRQASSQ